MAMDVESNTAALINMRNDLTDMQQKVAGNSVLISRFDTALDKISEVSLNVSKLLAVHEQRLESHEEVARKHDVAIAAVYERVASTEATMRQEMHTGQKEILVEIKSLRGDMNTLSKDVKDSTEELEKDVDKKLSDIGKRVDKVEKIGWLIVGGGAVCGFIASQASNIVDLFK